jgi:hypothetical protein
MERVAGKQDAAADFTQGLSMQQSVSTFFRNLGVFMKRTLLLCLALFLGMTFSACKKEEGAGAPPAPKLQAKMKLGPNGEITWNGKAVTQEEFMAELGKLKQAGGGITYWRDNIQGESTPAQGDVLRVINEAEVPIQTSKSPL